MNGSEDDLAAVAQLMLDLELARLRTLIEEVAHGKSAVADLDRQRAERSAELTAVGPDAAFSMGRDWLWEKWLAEEHARLSVEVARRSARREAQRRKAQLAFGRVTALNLMKEAEREARALYRRRQAAVDGGGES